MYYWFGMSFIWWIVWIAAIVAFFAFLTPIQRRRGPLSLADPLEILKRRYAAGELTTAEYDERRDRLLDSDHRGGDVAHPTERPPPARAAEVEHRTDH